MPTQSQRHHRTHNDQSSSLPSGFSGFAAFSKNKNSTSSSNWNKAVESQWSAPQEFINEASSVMERSSGGDPFDKYKTKSISERENDYTSRWRNVQLSPERVDPFAKHISEQEKKTKRTYHEIYEENKLEREKKHLLYQMKKKQILGNEKIQQQETASQPGSSQHHYNEKEDNSAQEENSAIVNVGISFELSGVLVKQTNVVNQKGTVLKWQAPPECRLPDVKWMMFEMKDDKAEGEPFLLYKQKAWLFGRDSDVSDIPTLNPSCSKQHAVICFRFTTGVGDDKRARLTGQSIGSTKPFIIDLQSTNGTFVNGERIPDSLYYELREFDLIRFGTSSREYMILHDKSEAK
ncbi:hypothetical protein FDP41_005450 [Naegleria fowleri]|uniref:FHA domain-containing protein n=1 Tax=Naegleria fowleri TaxID=5763 RepID=A0A6A5BKP1_NAEFO|nr:uncharacterized protein FDP41_005450 [Naegleria fowleri]KAF0975456.1 hypothetical protein FDP41_005450 [Naegleria fowleri]CAG4707690.1 unnamed protein product [Naegleria fowleri]